MKKQVLALCFLFSALLGFIYFASALQGRPGLLFFGETENAAAALESFRLAHVPIAEINFSALYGGNEQYQVLHPLLGLQKLRVKNASQSCGEAENSAHEAASGAGATCSLTNSWPSTKIEKERLFATDHDKREALDQFLTKRIKIPESFVLSPPFVDSLGFSFAYFLITKDVAPFNEKSWVMRHLSLYQTSELREIIRRYQIDDPTYSIIAQTSEAEMAEIVKGGPVVFTHDHLFVKNEAQLGFSPLSYAVYDRATFQSSTRNSDYTLVPFSSGDICLQKIGNACWTYSSNQAVRYLYKYSLLVMALLAVIFVGFLAFYFKNQLARVQEQRRQRLSLQVLSHELRTPVSSMLLLSEQMAKRIHKFDSDEQDALTRMSSEIYKMQRFVEVSKNYLQTAGAKIQFQASEIASLNDWVRDLAHEFGGLIRCELLVHDRVLRTDLFWLRLVLTNLLQNAIHHGAEPIFLRLSEHGDSIKIIVEDRGRCEFSTLKQMTEPFMKGAKSKGMGLGLNIVSHVSAECGYDLRFSKEPTAFSIVVHRLRQREATL